ncbi:hypothetical protein EVAR_30371_1 [Eumeta japonica]|uniref:Uncharacterized protein n=1 Tax=Eumeta variegata TaxID=151549 RepID=A0A4C1W6R8_EUMVA|nr:hypothetical protein EVAR_30371_1 [Eumeta japonica]
MPRALYACTRKKKPKEPHKSHRPFVPSHYASERGMHSGGTGSMVSGGLHVGLPTFIRRNRVYLITKEVKEATLEAISDEWGGNCGESESKGGGGEAPYAPTTHPAGQRIHLVKCLNNCNEI